MQLLQGKHLKMWKNVSVTDGLPAKRMEKLNYSKKEKLLSSNSSTTFIFRVVQFFQFVWLVGRQLLTPCEIFALKKKFENIDERPHEE